jgi:glycosyltransferase involved in cell wall biosynthesis
MKKVLLVGHEYFPLSTPGAFRLRAFAQYLPAFGYEPHILAIGWDETNVDSDSWRGNCLDPEAPADLCPVTRFYYRFPSRWRIPTILRNYTTCRLWPMSWPWPLTRLFRDHMERLHRQHAFDVVLTTIPSTQPMKAASVLHTRYALPWIIDFRDIEGQLPLHRSRLKPWHYLLPVYERWAIACQAKLARQASAVVTVSQALAEMLAAQGGPHAHVVNNGFDPAEFPSSARLATDRFQIVYAGTVLPRHRSPELLLDALDILCRSAEISNRDFSLDFYGTMAEHVRPLAQGRPCDPLVHVHPRLGKRDSHRIMANAGILLHLSTPGTRGIMTSKLTVYLGARRPVLSVPGDGDVVDQVLAATGAGLSLNHPAQIAHWILAHYRYWKEHGVYMVPALVEKEVARYTWHEQVKRLVQVLDDALRGHGPALARESQ